MFFDPIADMLTRIRNAQATGKREVQVPFSNLKKGIADILHAEGYLAGVEVADGHPKVMMLALQYDGKEPRIASIKRESKPGHRMYRKSEALPRILNDYGIAILSTSKGLMTNKQARKEGLGGEVICSVY